MHVYLSFEEFGPLYARILGMALAEGADPGPFIETSMTTFSGMVAQLEVERQTAADHSSSDGETDDVDARIAEKSVSVIVVLLVSASVVQACPVCMLADPKTAGTYLSMTLMMSVLPLAMIGCLIYWLKRRYSPPSPARLARNESPRLAELAPAHRHY